MTHPEITPEYLNELKALCEKATDGPWEPTYLDCGCCSDVKIPNSIAGQPTNDGRKELLYWIGDDLGRMYPENAEFISASRTAVPALIAEIERLQKENKELKDDVQIAHGNLESLK